LNFETLSFFNRSNQHDRSGQTMNQRTRYSALAAWLVAASLAPQAIASGFQLREQSPSAQGTSFAGVSAGGDDIGSMFFNPAAMSLFQGNASVIGFSDVMPKAKLEDASGKRINGSTITPALSSTGNAAQSALLPNVYAMWSLSPDLKLGLSVNAPFGMATDYDATFVGRYHALKSDLQVIDFAPNIAYRINSQWSFGAALVARKVDAELTNGVDFGLLIGAPGAFDGVASLKGSKWGYGYRLGVIYEPTDTVRFGLAHHSAMDIKLKGDATFQFKAGTPAPAIANLQASGFVDGGATAELNLPSTTSLGFQVELSPAISLQGEIAQTAWSSFKELRVDFDSKLPDSVTEEQWRDTWFYALGLTWKASDAWTLRTGLAYDQSAVKDEFRTPRIPDGNRTWVSLGAGYAFSQKVSVDFAYTHIFVTDGPLELKAVPAGYTNTTSPNKYRGDLSGTYKNSIDILSAQAKFTF
jgi:long-chain fatty acid transport protein